MDDQIKQVTAPMMVGSWVVGYVPEIHTQGTEQPFQASTYELELIARYWANEIKLIKDEWDYWGQSGSTGIRLKPYAYYRLRKLGEILGEDRVAQILDEVNQERFMTSVFEVSEKNEHPNTPENDICYTSRGRSIVFHQSRAGLQPMVGVTGISGDGWCWQGAEDYKKGKAVEHVGFATAGEALHAAQEAEDAFFKEVERKFQAACDYEENTRQRKQGAEEAIEELCGALAEHPVQGSYRVWSSDRELCEKVSRQNLPLQNRVEVRLREGAFEKSSARIFIDWLHSDHWGRRVSVTVDASSEAWEHHEALFHAMIAMPRRFIQFTNYTSELCVHDCETILKAAGFADVTRQKTERELLWGIP